MELPGNIETLFNTCNHKFKVEPNSYRILLQQHKSTITQAERGWKIEAIQFGVCHMDPTAEQRSNEGFWLEVKRVLNQ